jgi:hypothetical protein
VTSYEDSDHRMSSSNLERRSETQAEDEAKAETIPDDRRMTAASGDMTATAAVADRVPGQKSRMHHKERKGDSFSTSTLPSTSASSADKHRRTPTRMNHVDETADQRRQTPTAGIFPKHRPMSIISNGRRHDALRKAIRVRSCMICRSTRRLELHHAGCRVEPRNLSLLCARCHHLVHHIVSAATREEWSARVVGHAGARWRVWNRVRLGVAAAAFRIDRWSGLNQAQAEMRVLRESARCRQRLHRTA